MQCSNRTSLIYFILVLWWAGPGTCFFAVGACSFILLCIIIKSCGKHIISGQMDNISHPENFLVIMLLTGQVLLYLVFYQFF